MAYIRGPPDCHTQHSRVETVEEVVDVAVDHVAVRVHLVEDLGVALVRTEPSHLDEGMEGGVFFYGCVNLFRGAVEACFFVFQGGLSLLVAQLFF